MLRIALFVSSVMLCLAFAPCRAQGQEEPEDPMHNELRALRQGLVEAVNAGDLDQLLTYLHDDVVVTWLDGVQSRGHDEVREYYRSKTEGEDAIVESFSVDPKVTELSFLYGEDTAVAYGD